LLIIKVTITLSGCNHSSYIRHRFLLTSEGQASGNTDLEPRNYRNITSSKHFSCHPGERGMCGNHQMKFQISSNSSTMLNELQNVAVSDTTVVDSSHLLVT